MGNATGRGAARLLDLTFASFVGMKKKKKLMKSIGRRSTVQNRAPKSTVADKQIRDQPLTAFNS